MLNAVTDPDMNEITLLLNARQIGELEKLLNTGMWGNSIDEVAMRLLDQQIMFRRAESRDQR
jgi:hypothetical protein